MSRIIGGFLIGFSLATLIFFLIVYMMLSPYSAQITSAYQITQAGWFDNALSVLGTIQGLSGNVLAQLIPGISNINQAVAGIMDFMITARQTLSILYTLLRITIPVIIGSVIVLVVGIFVAKRPERKAISVEHKEGKGKHCGHCGAKVYKGDEFCGGCGKKI